MQVPFPEMTELLLLAFHETPPVIPESSLGGSAPRLRALEFGAIQFPGLPKLLLSATHLVELRFLGIPHSGYISPEAVVPLLSVLSGLERLSIQFKSPQSHPDLESRRPPPLKLSVIPSLTSFYFKGVGEYLEDLVTCIDAPQLDYLTINFFNQIDFDTPRLAEFISRTPKFSARDEAHVQFNDGAVDFQLTYRTHEPGYETFRIRISCIEPDWQPSSIAQVCDSALPPFSTIQVLYIEHRYQQLDWKDDAIEKTLWLALLPPFTAVRDHHLPRKFAPGIAAALQELVRGRITEFLPNLRNIIMVDPEPQEPFQEHIGEFVAARQLSSHLSPLLSGTGKRRKSDHRRCLHLLRRPSITR